MKFDNLLNDVSKSDNLFGTFLSFLIKLFSNSVIQAIINLVVATLASVRSYQNNQFDITFVIKLLIIYIVLLLLMGYANHCNKINKLEYSLTQQSLEQGSAILCQLQEKLKDISTSKQSNESIFRIASEYVVKAIYDLLNTYYPKKQFRILIFQKFLHKDRRSKYCKMIAYKHFVAESPEHLRKDYSLGSVTHAKPYFVKLFENNCRENKFLKNYQEIQREFSNGGKDKIRIRQCASYPVQMDDTSVDFIVQICSYSDNVIRGEDDLKLIEEKIMIPVIQILRVAYEIENSLNKKGDAKN